MKEIQEFLNRYLDAEYETHKLDLVAKDAETVFEAFTDMTKEYFAKPDIQDLSDYLHGQNPNPKPERRKAMTRSRDGRSGERRKRTNGRQARA